MSGGGTLDMFTAVQYRADTVGNVREIQQSASTCVTFFACIAAMPSTTDVGEMRHGVHPGWRYAYIDA